MTVHKPEVELAYSCKQAQLFSMEDRILQQYLNEEKKLVVEGQDTCKMFGESPARKCHKGHCAVYQEWILGPH